MRNPSEHESARQVVMRNEARPLERGVRVFYKLMRVNGPTLSVSWLNAQVVVDL